MTKQSKGQQAEHDAKTLGAQIDALGKLEAKRKTIAAQLDVVKREIDAQEVAVLAALNAAKLDGARGKLGSVRRETREHPQIVKEQFDKLWAYMKKHDAPELLQRRLGSGAVKERWEAGEVVPGVTKFTEIVVVFTPGKG